VFYSKRALLICLNNADDGLFILIDVLCPLLLNSAINILRMIILQPHRSSLCLSRNVQTGEWAHVMGESGVTHIEHQMGRGRR